ncbi:hypothetical protein EJM73_06435 [Clostridium botulinum]|uniref:homing endonuclease associated repeat-containing protein n=1 Tax=Clostridium botulinum TaxID=1491 RepID=UPI00099B41A8|nr:hypothetical protein [Clostridium botulinum]MCC5439782.1 hypothetical protein [Clostridium botulinum]NCI20594.1 hypothetical protein [Clostridium botulinum]NCI35303.1 hypothetical protein [Clostridium botulinum]NCI72105.1 hypothetical protein [Clostridium botulinum]NDI38218.1 hypothetical protein [Clostridium botulinum]
MKNKYTDEYLKTIVLNKQKELGRTPKRREVSPHGFAIAQRFGEGKWNKALSKLGLEVNIPKSYTKNELIKIMKDWYKEKKIIPSVNMFANNENLPDPKTYREKFQMKWSEVVEYILDVKTSERPSPYDEYTDEYLLKIFKEEYYKINPISKAQFGKEKSSNIPSFTYYRNRFNKTWNELKKLAGIHEIINERRTKEEWIKIIKDVVDDLGYIPSSNKFEEICCSTKSFEPVLGNYNNALKEIGFEPPNESPVIVEVDTKKLLEMYIEFSKKLGRLASNGELDNSKDIYNADVFIIRFGSMYALKKEANKILEFDIDLQNKEKYTREKILNLLIQEYKVYNRRLTNKEVNINKNLPSISTILRKFTTTKMNVVWCYVEKFINEK